MPSSLIHCLAVGLGGAVGAMGRYAINLWVFPVMGDKFPLATLLVNTLGSALMGLCYVLFVERGLLSNEWRLCIMMGMLGAFTTFSTFSLDALVLWQNGQPTTALLYVLLSVLLCLIAAYLSLVATRAFF